MVPTTFVLRNIGLPLVENIPIIGPYVVKPARLTVDAVLAIASLALALLSASLLLVTILCRLTTASIYVLSSTGSGLYHLFAASKKAQ